MQPSESSRDTASERSGSDRGWPMRATVDRPEVVTDPVERRWIGLEIVLVLAATVGYSAVRSLLRLVENLMAPEPLREQSVALNAPQAELSWIDLAHQLAINGRMLAFGALALYLLWRAGIALRTIGIDRARPAWDIGAGVLLTAVIGIPGLALYFGSYALGFSVTVQPSVLDDTWWRIPVLILGAFANSWLEEVIVVAYLLTRLRQLGMSGYAALVLSSVIRGAYHLYQGIGGFVGNVIMGLIFGRFWQHTGRLWPLVIAHMLLDVFAFVGYALLEPSITGLLERLTP